MAVQTVQAVVGGQTYTLAYDSASGTYKATITAPGTSSYNMNDGHYLPVTVRATDEAGNVTTADDTDETLGSALRLRVKETVAPVISITSPTSGSILTNNKPAFAWKVTDNDSGVYPDTISIKIDANAAVTTGITKTAISGGYSCSYTPASALSDGAHTLTFAVSDHDGNAAAAVSVGIKVDTVPPTLTLSSPADSLVTNSRTLTVSGTTNDATSSPVTLTVGGSAVTVGPDGAFSTTVDLSEGENTITVAATDAAGKTSTVTRTVTLDTAAPTISGVTVMPNPVDAGATYVITVTAVDP